MIPFGFRGPTYKVNQVPEHFHELFIVGGYRHPQSTAFQCIRSLFYATNETLNFWTHFLPSFYFLWVLRGLNDTLDFREDFYSWPMLCYLLACCAFPLASASAHTFNTMSDKARHICFFLDYAALSMFSLSASIAYRCYVFPSHLAESWFGAHYVPMAIINAIASTIISCQTRFMKPSVIRKILRLTAFAIPYHFDSIPVYDRLLFCIESDCHLASQTLHLRSFLFGIMAAFLYVSHLPERLNPGAFDIIGHSHQLFHICSIFGVISQMQAVLLDMQDRKEVNLLSWSFPTLSSSLGLVFVVIIVNTVIVALYSWRLSTYSLGDLDDIQESKETTSKSE